MQIISYSFVNLKHFQINSQFRNIHWCWKSDCIFWGAIGTSANGCCIISGFKRWVNECWRRSCLCHSDHRGVGCPWRNRTPTCLPCYHSIGVTMTPWDHEAIKYSLRGSLSNTNTNSDRILMCKIDPLYRLWFSETYFTCDCVWSMEHNYTCRDLYYYNDTSLFCLTLYVIIVVLSVLFCVLITANRNNWNSNVAKSKFHKALPQTMILMYAGKPERVCKLCTWHTP